MPSIDEVAWTIIMRKKGHADAVAKLVAQLESGGHMSVDDIDGLAVVSFEDYFELTQGRIPTTFEGLYGSYSVAPIAPTATAPVAVPAAARTSARTARTTAPAAARTARTTAPAVRATTARTTAPVVMESKEEGLGAAYLPVKSSKPRKNKYVGMSISDEQRRTVFHKACQKKARELLRMMVDFLQIIKRELAVVGDAELNVASFFYLLPEYTAACYSDPLGGIDKVAAFGLSVFEEAQKAGCSPPEAEFVADQVLIAFSELAEMGVKGHYNVEKGKITCSFLTYSLAYLYEFLFDTSITTTRKICTYHGCRKGSHVHYFNIVMRIAACYDPESMSAAFERCRELALSEAGTDNDAQTLPDSVGSVEVEGGKGEFDI